MRAGPDRLSALRRVATIESIGSSTRIEGSKLSDSDVERLLANLEIRHFATRDEQDVAGYAEVMQTVFASFGAIALREHAIWQQVYRLAFLHWRMVDACEFPVGKWALRHLVHDQPVIEKI